MGKSTPVKRPQEDRRRDGAGVRRKAASAAAMFSCLVILVAVMYGGLTLYNMYLEKTGRLVNGSSGGLDLDDDGNVIDNDGNVVGVISDSVVYSQEELDRRVDEASALAQAQGAEDVLDTIMNGLSESDSVLETLRPLYPDHIIIYSGGAYHFIPINRDMAANNLIQENVNVLESGEFQYLTDGQVTSHKGIDVSKFQGEIDWSQVAGDGVEFAFIRVGSRAYGSSGQLLEDERFDENIKGAQAAGIKVGVYFYTQAITEEEVLEEAQYVLDKIEPYSLDCPVVFDVEKTDSSGGRMNSLTAQERTEFTKLFCDTIKNAGYRPMIYYNLNWGMMALDLSQLEEYDKWFASWSSTLYYPYEYKVWQYTKKGHVQGIGGEVDMSISFAPLWQ